MTQQFIKANKQKKPISEGKIKWFNIDWQKATVQVKQYETQIAVAFKAGELTKVKLLQHK